MAAGRAGGNLIGSRRAALCAACILLSACAGSGSSVAPAPRLSGGTPVPVAGRSRYAIESVPAGLAVQSNGLAFGVTTSAGSAPLSITPPFSAKTLLIDILPSNGAAPFGYVIDQTADGNHTILYNQTADTNGSIGSIAAVALGRRTVTSGHPFAARELRFAAPSLHGLPLFSATRLAVHYAVAALRRSGRRAADLERAGGVVRAVDLGFAQDGQITRILDVPPGVTLATLASRLRAQPEVVAMEPVQLRYPAAASAFTPNDTHFDGYEQWDMFDVLAPNAWSFTEGQPLPALGATGVSVAILDTGLDAGHRDLAGGKVIYGESVLDGVVTPGLAAAQDTDGHGTNVSGIAAADTNNGFGFAGVGFNTTIQIYKIFPNKSGTHGLTTTAADEAQAIYDAVANGARVINMSLSSPQGSAGFNAIERDAVEYALAHGVSVVASAGNDRAGGATTIEYPAAYAGVVSVGATALDDSASPRNAAGAREYVASYSNSGPNLTLVAPGGDPPAAEASGNAPIDDLHWIENIYTTTPIDASLACSNVADCKAFFAGTSQAAPHVTGTIALMLALNPALTPAQILTILETTSDDIGDPNQGHGRLDAYRALAAAGGDASGVPLPGNANFVAFAYAPDGSNVPRILDVTYPRGIPVASDGTFRVADIPADAPAYAIGVWADLNGDGAVDAGDYFGSSGPCTAGAPCAGAAGIVVHPVAAGFVP